MGRVQLAVAGLVAVVALGGCRLEFGPKAAAHKAWRDAAFDAESLKFRNERVVGGGVCGEVNGANGFGGRTGFLRYVYTPDGELMSDQVMRPTSDDLSLLYLAERTGSSSGEMYTRVLEHCAFERQWAMQCDGTPQIEESGLCADFRMGVSGWRKHAPAYYR